MTGGLLALDLARRVGWAAVPTTYRSPAFPVPNEQFEKLRFGSHQLVKPTAPAGAVYLALHQWFTATLKELQPHYVAVEAAFAPQPFRQGSEMAFGLAAIIEMNCHYRNIPLYRAATVTIKKFWTGNHRATKDVMIEFAEKRGLEVQDDNAADACALADYMVADLTLNGHWPPRRGKDVSRIDMGSAATA
jgi:Holliday junction resolvasome RuvABC endonuclease subunit